MDFIHTHELKYILMNLSIFIFSITLFSDIYIPILIGKYITAQHFFTFFKCFVCQPLLPAIGTTLGTVIVF